MEPFSLAWAAEVLGARVIGTPEGAVRAVCTDTRQDASGALFFALSGENADGHRFVAQAFEKGAVGAVVSREVEGVPGPLLLVQDTLRAFGDLAMRYRRQFDIPVVGVTGSVGKTSTKEMIAAVLRTKYHTLASAKNYNNEIGVPLTIFQLTKAHQAAVIEMGMRGPGEIDRLAEIAQPTVGVITNIGYAHAELLGSISNIAKAKSELLARLPAGGVAVVPSCGYVLKLLQAVPPGCRTIVVSSGPTRPPSPPADIYYVKERNIRSRLFADRPFHGVPDRIRVNGKEIDINLQAVGEHHYTNALKALAVAVALDVPIPEAIAALEPWEGAEGRMAVRTTADGITLLDDCYNAGPESMAAAIHTLERMAQKNRVAVLGDMRELGRFTKGAHWDVGELVVDARVERLITVGDMAQEIANCIVSYTGALSNARHRVELPEMHHFASTEEAAAHIRELVRPGDTVLVKGSRAMQMEQIVAALALTPPAPLSHRVGEGGVEEGRDA